MNSDEFERKSKELGLEKLAANHAADLRKALENSSTIAQKIPTDLHWSEEPAHTFNLTAHSKVQS